MVNGDFNKKKWGYTQIHLSHRKTGTYSGGGGGSRNLQAYWKCGTYWKIETHKTLSHRKLRQTGTYLEHGFFVV